MSSLAEFPVVLRPADEGVPAPLRVLSCRLRHHRVVSDVPVMWYAHIRDLSPTAEAVRGAVRPR